MGIEMHQAHMLVLSPVSSVWAEKKNKPGTHSCSVPPGFLGISIKSVCYTNLRGTCQLFPHERSLPLTMLCVDDDEGVIKAISSSLTGIIHVFVLQLNAMAHD